MPTGPARHPLRLGALLAAVSTLVVSGCGRFDPQLTPTNPGATATASASPSGSDSASPGATASPGGTASPAGTATATGSSAASPSGSVAAAACTSITPVRIERSTVEPRRTTEIVTVVSDGRNLTPGTREQTEFADPVLTAPDGTTNTDETTLTKIAELIETSSKNTVLLARPDPPDTGIDANKRPYNATGTYVLYNASGLLSADVVVQCSTDQSAGAGGQEQRWRFTAEADNALGTVNCAVEPPKGNAVARQVYGSFC